MPKNKVMPIEAALPRVESGMTLAIGGFLGQGHPLTLGPDEYFFLGDNYGKLYEQYKGLLDPCISEHTDQKMLEYKGMGDPNKTAMKAFSTLFKTYYSLKDVDKLGYVYMPRKSTTRSSITTTKSSSTSGTAEATSMPPTHSFSTTLSLA